MADIFLKLVNMSITAVWLILAVIVLRALLKQAPKSVRLILWAMVGIRLVCPFSFESVVSLIPSDETIPSSIQYSSSPAIDSGLSSVNNIVNPIISDTLSPAAEDSVNPMQIVIFIASVIWLVGWNCRNADLHTDKLHKALQKSKCEHLSFG